MIAMEASFLDVDGETIAPELLTLPRANELALRLRKRGIDYASLVACRRGTEGMEWVVFDVEVEVPQRRENPVLPRERLAVGFVTADDKTPEVLALRADFPLVPHINLRDQELPRSLCLYEEGFHELRSRWTPSRFVQRIRDWLKLTAQGRLHRPDQPLEPFLGQCAGHLILPAKLENPIPEPLPLRLEIRSINSDGKFVMAPARGRARTEAPELIASVHLMPAQVHGVIRRSPPTLSELGALLKEAGLDLLAQLRSRLKEWRSMKLLKEEAKAMIVLQVPLRREGSDEPESTESWGFWLGNAGDNNGVGGVTLGELGAHLGVWANHAGNVGLLIRDDLGKDGRDVSVHVLNVSYELTRAKAAIQSGDSHARTINITAVGVGALGSQVALNLIRSGFGCWTFVDNDVLMPHNLSRHALDGQFVGLGKAQSMAWIADSIYGDGDGAKHLAVDVLHRESFREPLGEAWKDAVLILDMSASIAVARTLAHDLPGNARRVSLFLSPSGRDLVMLAEDSGRKIQLDSLEMQYYRCILEAEPLRGHLEPADDGVRYGRTCRDVSSRLPQDLVALHAAIAANAVRKLPDRPGGSISIWGAQEYGSVRHIEFEIQPVLRRAFPEWTLIMDGGLVDKLACLRGARLPAETGGVLLGSFDTERRIIYVADALPAPPDSQEWPTLFIRGSKGLREVVDAAVEATRGMIEYVGEWHSHPRGASTRASQDDVKVFAWLTSLMDKDSLPAVMIIVGDNAEVNCFVGSIGGTAEAAEGAAK